MRIFPYVRILLLVLCMFSLSAISEEAIGNSERGRDAFERICFQCHSMDNFMYGRSRKAWELTVDRMRNYTYGEQKFEDSEAELITSYLGDRYGEDYYRGNEVSSKEPEPMPFQAPVPGPVSVKAPEQEQVPVKSQEFAEVVVPKILPTTAQLTAEKGIWWRPSQGWLVFAKVSAYAACFALAGLFLTGLNRKRFALNFRRVHVVFALTLFMSLFAHCTIFILRYGGPSVLWYWFGVLSTFAVVVTEVQGLLVKKFGRVLLVFHKTGAWLGLIMMVLHWIWAWL